VGAVYPAPAGAARHVLHSRAMNGHDIPAWDTRLHELADGVFAYVQAGGGFCVANAGVIASGDDAIVIDALFSPPMTRAFKDTVVAATRAVPRRLVNTHHHVDHTLGNAMFPEATIIAQASARDHVVANGYPRERLLGIAPYFEPDLPPDLEVRPPNLVFESSLTLFAGARRVELRHAGHAHTVGDVLVHLPEERVLFAGDICFFYVTPLAFEGNIGNWIRVLAAIEQMGNVETIVPGHGPLGTADHVREVRAYFEAITAAARKHFEAGDGEDAAANAIALGAFAGWAEAERIVPNVYRLYAEFRGDPGGPIDVARAFSGMAEYAARH
jgi:cyclase